LGSISVISGLVPNPVLASASVEEQAQVTAKKYASGNSIELVCEKIGSTNCVVISTMYKKKRRLSIDFDDYGVRPNMQEIRLYVQSLDGSEYSFLVSATCQDEDMALIPEEINTAYCLAQFRVAHGEIEGRPEVQIFPITTQQLYRKTEPRRP
jgi:hypothetical protein